MPEFFLELFSEEIPARMQEHAATQLQAICAQALKPLQCSAGQIYYGPRRLALRADTASAVPETVINERGPRVSAPEQALLGFLRKHGASRAALVQDGDFWVLNKKIPGQSAASFITATLPEALAKFPWPKSMRWGTSGDFTWVRPLRRITCLLDGEVIPFTLGPVTASNLTEGHRVHGPGPFAVSSAAMWEEKLREHRVIVNQDERRDKMSAGLAALAGADKMSVVPDEALLDEVAGLVEWPVPLLGRIDAPFMELPPEVRELSMKINQKYFALRDATGKPAPYFAFVANLEAPDGGAAIIAGNERVLRARLSDARHFWDLDRKTPLEALLPKLETITFHAKIGTQAQRAARIAYLAERIAQLLAAQDAELAAQAHKAGLLCKADLVSHMVGEFPELQGVMGGYYAAHVGDLSAAAIGAAIKTHYLPKGPHDAVPSGIVAVSVALADKLDSLRTFFGIGEKPTGSGDPYALRRCALGVIRIILENRLRLHLKPLLNHDDELFGFIIERLRVKLRGEGKRFDILDAVLAAGGDDDLIVLEQKIAALSAMLGTGDGANLLAAYKRAANILRLEAARDGAHAGLPDPAFFAQVEEIQLAAALEGLNAALLGGKGAAGLLAAEDYAGAMRVLAAIRPALDAFFEKVTVNAESPELRRNRLRLLSCFVGAVQQVADFTRIEG